MLRSFIYFAFVFADDVTMDENRSALSPLDRIYTRGMMRFCDGMKAYVRHR